MENKHIEGSLKERKRAGLRDERVYRRHPGELYSSITRPDSCFDKNVHERLLLPGEALVEKNRRIEPRLGE